VPVDSTVIDGLNKTTVSRNSTQGPVPVRLDDNPPGVVSSNYSSQSPKSMQNSSVAAPDLVPSSTELKLLRGVCSWKGTFKTLRSIILKNNMMGQVEGIQAITKCNETAALLQYCALTISGSRATCILYFPAIKEGI